ncbi:acyl-CoA carboxylase epsilon subunit [Kineosporia succinea]|uniref:Acyl-CoA carboxylase epsilon subunit-like protein n=1 Tax=Kineosporia succinea TaxID=84632 RepID=A0ABT9P3W5_9ACTN|nr:acyl-CoA carboxylase epsilon subunit [Kineosporia succinea]MDP9827358.1 hypothetical protein [Kineosporia succinea]
MAERGDVTGTSDVTAPVLRLVRGDATAEEVAALVAALGAVRDAGVASAGDAAGAPALTAHGRTPRSGWRDRSALVRRPLSPGPGAWRASGFAR